MFYRAITKPLNLKKKKKVQRAKICLKGLKKGLKNSGMRFESTCKLKIIAFSQWLTFIILATWEAEIGRISV
jgi:hypothetical protein